MINLVAFPLLIGIGIDYGIFIVSAARRRDPSQLPPAVSAVTMCSATTVLGFASLVLTSVPAVQSMGSAVAVGVAAAAVSAVLLVLPLSVILQARMRQ
jgi:predicted RND superfamily exporter protein